jgi:hypothetical protein
MPEQETIEKQWKGCEERSKTIFDYHNFRIRIHHPLVQDVQLYAKDLEEELNKNKMTKAIMYVFKEYVSILISDNRFRLEGILFWALFYIFIFFYFLFYFNLSD